MVWLASLTGFLGGIIAAGVAAFAVMRSNSSRMAADIRARWGQALLERAASSRLRRGVSGTSLSATAVSSTKRGRAISAHGSTKLMNSFGSFPSSLRLVGNQRVQIAARVVQYHAYAVRVQGEENRDPREEERPEKPPVARLNDALQEFYRPVCQQLRAADPEGVIHSDNLEEIAKGLSPSPGANARPLPSRGRPGIHMHFDGRQRPHRQTRLRQLRVFPRDGTPHTYAAVAGPGWPGFDTAYDYLTIQP